MPRNGVADLIKLKRQTSSKLLTLYMQMLVADVEYLKRTSDGDLSEKSLKPTPLQWRKGGACGSQGSWTVEAAFIRPDGRPVRSSRARFCFGRISKISLRPVHRLRSYSNREEGAGKSASDLRYGEVEICKFRGPYTSVG